MYAPGVIEMDMSKYLGLIMKQSLSMAMVRMFYLDVCSFHTKVTGKEGVRGHMVMIEVVSRCVHWIHVEVLLA